MGWSLVCVQTPKKIQLLLLRPGRVGQPNPKDQKTDVTSLECNLGIHLGQPAQLSSLSLYLLLQSSLFCLLCRPHEEEPKDSEKETNIGGSAEQLAENGATMRASCDGNGIEMERRSARGRGKGKGKNLCSGLGNHGAMGQRE